MVFKAEDLKLGRLVALKFLPEGFASDAVALKRFEREAQTASALNHPNICTIHEIEEHEGQPFIAIELLQGDNLRDRLSASKQKSLALPELLGISAQICEGLQAAHDKGIIHRDIKPANIFLCESGSVKILDLGLAKRAGSDVALERAEAASTTVPKTSTESLTENLTRTGTAAGTAGPISDSIADAGNRYHLELRALDCGSGATLAEEETDISDRNQVVHELGATAVRLRRKLGEPADSLARFNQPLEKATSASLEALQTGTEGTKLFMTGNPQAALPLYQRGIELDPDLALTYEGIGAANGALGHLDLAAASFTRAYQLRDRMTEKDRLTIDFLYYSEVTGELDKAYSVLLRSLQLFPRDVFFHANLGNTLRELGQLKRAADSADETARLEPSSFYFS